MRATRWIVLGPVLAFTLLLAAACNGDGPAAAPPPASEGTASMVDPGQSRAAMPALNTAQPSGIAVSGTGMVFAEPDRAVVTLGVEARAETVSTARADAARAMTAIIAALGADGIAEQDIQTRSFDISPQYSRRERTDSSGARYNEQVLLGFIVSNQAAVNVRNMENIGGILDRVAEAGGDLTRIRGISFSSDDPTQLHAQAREAAVKDLMAKAQHYATLANRRARTHRLPLRDWAHARGEGQPPYGPGGFRLVGAGLPHQRRPTLRPSDRPRRLCDPIAGGGGSSR